MPSLILQLRAGQRIAVFDEHGNAELIDFDNQRDDHGELVVTDHVLIRNIYRDNDIYDEVAAYWRGEPARVIPANTLGIPNDSVTPALLEPTTPSCLRMVR